jgi:protein involved in polysaccharide export with SLBB domain
MMRSIAWGLGLLGGLSLAAQEDESGPITAADVSPLPTTSWRHSYTLGPGDILHFAFYGRPELDRNDVFVQPDGSISYLQASGVRAEGRTVDELRDVINERLAEHYRNPAVMIFPWELRSKRYFILGKVIDNGAYPMDHPITIIEAVARARGIETGLFEENTVELADLPRSFLMRGDRRMPIDFEALFFDGDLSQNIELEPNDFLYFPSANTNELYVLGEVVLPGVLGFTPRSSVISAITERGGFTDDAFKQRVLVVRGSLQNPELFVIDTSDVLTGMAIDFKLEPKDIIYVATKPWAYAEELADDAIDFFLRSMTASWTLQNIDPLIDGPVLPQLREEDAP